MSEEALRHLRKADPVLARLMKKAGPFALEMRAKEEVFPAMVRNIVYQQLSGKAAATIHGRLLALLPPRTRIVKPSHFLALELAALRAAGLSGQKASYLIDLCEKAESGLVPTRRKLEAMSDDDIVAALTHVKGIGVWTVEMFLMFSLGRLDVLPTTDYGVRKGFAKVYGWDDLPTPRELRDYGERWRPYRSIPSWYMWRALEL